MTDHPIGAVESPITRQLGDAVELLDGIAQDLEETYGTLAQTITGLPADAYRGVLRARDLSRQAYYALLEQDERAIKENREKL